MRIDFSQIIDLTLPVSLQLKPSELVAPYPCTVTTYKRLSRKEGHGLEPDEVVDAEKSPDCASLYLREYFGLTVLLEVPDADELTGPMLQKLVSTWAEEIQAAGAQLMMPPALLLRSSGEKGRQVSLSADAILYLSTFGLELIGLESSQVAASDNRLMEALLDENQVAWLVNLDLQGVVPNRPYFLTALPVLKDVEGVLPCRATLALVEE